MTNQGKINLEPIRNLRHSQKNILFQSTENKSKKIHIFKSPLVFFTIFSENLKKKITKIYLNFLQHHKEQVTQIK